MYAQVDNNPPINSISKGATDTSFSASMPSSIKVKAKLEMTQPSDAEEQEAEAVADSIVNEGRIARAVSNGNSGEGVALSSSFGNKLSALQGQGSRLYGGLKEKMESGFGRDFSNVRLHTDEASAEMSSSISAKAFTYGNDIYFNQGQFNPKTRDGQKLLAHELAHVAQGKGRVSRKKEEGKSKDGLLSDSQLLLLNMLTYIPVGKRMMLIENGRHSLGQIIDFFEKNDPPSNWEYEKDETISKNDWQKTFKAIKADPVLREVILYDVDSIDPIWKGEKGFSILFRVPSSNEIVVAFRGTASKEWVDNFEGGTYTNHMSMTDESLRTTTTEEQEAALQSFQRLKRGQGLYSQLSGEGGEQFNSEDCFITVTGHSKGGNKAKFITLMDESVSRGVSYDGQGFSSEFHSQYRELIARRGKLIINHNSELDLVNILLDQIGEVHYHKAINRDYNLSVGKALFETHSPETLFDFDRESLSKEVRQDIRIYHIKWCIDSLLHYLKNDPKIDYNTRLFLVDDFLMSLGVLIQSVMGDENGSSIDVSKKAKQFLDAYMPLPIDTYTKLRDTLIVLLMDVISLYTEYYSRALAYKLIQGVKSIPHMALKGINGMVKKSGQVFNDVREKAWQGLKFIGSQVSRPFNYVGELVDEKTMELSKKVNELVRNMFPFDF